MIPNPLLPDGFPRTVALLAVLLGAGLSGCLGTVEEYYSFNADAQYINPGVFEGTYPAADGNGSGVLELGYLAPGTPEVYHLLSERPHGPLPGTEGRPESTVYITLAVWRPSNESIGPVPVLVDAGPYFEIGFTCTGTAPNQTCTPNTITRPSQTTPFNLKNFLPHGYAVAQVAVRGTGTSGGCMELFGPREAADLSQAITWLARQPWSNGHVAMMGASYDGSTPWMVAGLGNPHLKTIVPVSGLPDPFDLMFRNGSAETRGPVFHSGVYWPFGFSRDFIIPGYANGREDYQNRQNLLCPDAYESQVTGPYASLMGDRASEFTDYWRERDYRDRVVKNYKGSVFLVHGLQDWNVDPHVAIPFNQRLREAGLDVKEWYGQWGHAFPDTGCIAKQLPRWYTTNCRLDYGQVLLQWFDYYLKGNTSRPLGPPVQVQDNRGYWRNADAFPPTGATMAEFYPAPDRQFLPESSPSAAARTLLPPLEWQDREVRHGPTRLLEFRTAPFDDDLRVSGLPQFHVEFEAMGPGGFLGAWLFEENETGKVLDRWGYNFSSGKGQPYSEYGVPPIVGHAQMDLRFHEGGEERQNPEYGQRYTARMEFEPLDLLVPKGHRLTLWLFQYKYPDRFSGPVPSPVKVILGGSGASTVLRLPTIDVSPETIFPVPGSHFPRPESFDRYYVDKPTYEQLVLPINDELDAGANCSDAIRGPIHATGLEGLLRSTREVQDASRAAVCEFRLGTD